ncbi:MAG: ABC transporter ATP-binding protein, partial [Candidatus Aminicenantes bacterium]|nr:ABC transporter ATP-binding protein [Candidatus Aminicenantes bacterium]
EPMSGLDPIGRKEVRDLISELKEQGKTVFFSSHIIPDVEMLCDRVAILVGGQLQDIGHLNEILETQVKYIEVVIRGLDESSVRSLEPFSEGYFQTGDRFVVRIMNEEDLEKVFNTAINFKGRIVSVSPVKETLEEHFIRKSKKARSV